MKVSDIAQARVFFINILLGMVCVLIYDVFRAVRRSSAKGELQSNLLDMMYFFMAFLLIFFVEVKFNFGALRYYQLMGLAIGAFFQIALFSRFEVRAFETAIRIFKLTIRFILRTLLFIPLKIFSLIFSLSHLAEDKIIAFFDSSARKSALKKRKNQKNKKIIKKRIKMF